ncbi:MAG: hypothetical protein COW71_09870 [Ignavibacteriales bacterium CG18_big_fil_WC_8_21_14_2_50_31_20]|nr:MAG: hypothetical protein COW71_09870 [Ignavibacteriales bacterium CG18_big_fil_WC_8_21_14_2_50_31_20]
MNRKNLFKNIIVLSILLAFISNKMNSATIDNTTNKDKIKIANDINMLLDSCWFYRTQNPILALDFGNKANSIIERSNYIELKPKTLNFLGVVQRKLGDLSKSHDYFMQALDLANLLIDSAQIGYTYNNLADYYIKKASYSIALENVLIGYQIFKNLNHKIGMAYSLNYLGEIYIHHSDYEKALKYLEEASSLRLELNDLRGYSNTLVNIGIIYFKKHDFNKARELYNKALKLDSDIKYEKGRANIFSLLGDINIANNDFETAIKSINTALLFSNKTKDKGGIIQNSNKLGFVYIKLGKWDKAKKILEEALILANKSEHLDEEMRSYLYLSDYYKETKQFETALSYLNKYIVLKDSIFSDENMGRFADLQTLFATENEKIENKLLRHEIENEKLRNNYLILISIIVFIAIILLVSKYKMQKKSNALLKELNSSKDKFFSILAHDLKNPFQALMGYTDMLNEDFDDFSEEEVKNSIKSLQNISHNVYDLLEGVLEWSRAQTGRMEFNPLLFALSVEVNSIIELYNENANSKGIKLISEIDSQISLFADRNMIKTIIRNLIANAIKFTKSGGSVNILAEKNKSEIKFIVADTGVGMTQEIIDSLFRIDTNHTTKGTNGEVGTGVGLILCYELVKLHKGKIWAESRLGIGSKFIFTIPI